jgi:hypothetical protein
LRSVTLDHPGYGEEGMFGENSDGDEYLFKNQIKFSNISDAWTIPLLRAQLASSEINVVQNMTIATIDSSSAYIMVPQSDFDLFLSSLKGLNCQKDKRTQLFTCDCEKVTPRFRKFYPLNLYMGGAKFSIPSDSYLKLMGQTCYIMI